MRKIHYEEQVRKNFNKYNLIDDKYDVWSGRIVRWYYKKVTKGYSTNSKHLYLYAESYIEFKAFI